MQVSDYLIDPATLASPWVGVTRPLAFVDLTRSSSDLAPLGLPPFPVIGLGDRSHPMAHVLDAVVEPPVSVASLVVQITRSPRAAALLVQLLRSIEGMAIGEALVMESLAYGVLQGGAEHTAWLASVIPTQAGTVATPACAGVSMRRAGNALSLRLNRPGTCNAVNAAMRDQLREAFTIAVLDDEIDHIILSGEGKAFSIGADLTEFGTTRDPQEAHRIRMQTLPAPVIARCADRFEAKVQGACVGSGLEMAAFAKRIEAYSDAWFQLPELAMGILPGAGGCVSVSRRIGRQRAALMMLSGKRINAQVALGWGLVDTVNHGTANEGL
jgi:enoyl-CoA hydratase/carnithine racemase